MPHRINYEVGTLAVDIRPTLGTAMRDWQGRTPPRPLLVVPNVTAHPSTASVPITIMLYNGPLLCDFSVPTKGLKFALNG